MEKYEQLARDILESTCETDEIFEDYDMDLLYAGYLDSFSLLNIIVEIEDKMGIALQPTDMKKDNIRTVNDMIRFLEQIGGKNG